MELIAVSMIALGGPKLKLSTGGRLIIVLVAVSMIALGGPKLKQMSRGISRLIGLVSMIALGGPKLKLAKMLNMHKVN